MLLVMQCSCQWSQLKATYLFTYLLKLSGIFCMQINTSELKIHLTFDLRVAFKQMTLQRIPQLKLHQTDGAVREIMVQTYCVHKAD